MIRSILAIGIGWTVIVLANVLTGALGAHPPSAGSTPALILLIRLLSIGVAGYIAALIGKRAPVAHALAVGGLSLCFQLLSSIIKEQQSDLGRWAVGATTAMLVLAAAGFFRSWQLHR